MVYFSAKGVVLASGGKIDVNVRVGGRGVSPPETHVPTTLHAGDFVQGGDVATDVEVQIPDTGFSPKLPSGMPPISSGRLHLGPFRTLPAADQKTLDETNVPPEFADALAPAERYTQIPNDLMKAYYLAYQRTPTEKRPTPDQIRETLQDICRRLGRYIAEYRIEVDPGSVCLLAMGLLIGGEIDLARGVAHDLETMALAKEYERAAANAATYRASIRLTEVQLGQKLKERQALLFELGKEVNRNLTDSYKGDDARGGVAFKVQELNGRISSLTLEIAKLRGLIDARAREAKKTERTANWCHYRILKDTGKSQNEIDRFLAPLSLDPDSIPTRKGFARVVAGARKRVVGRAKTGTFERLLYTDTAEAVRTAAARYQNDVELFGAIGRFKKIEGAYPKDYSGRLTTIEGEFKGVNIPPEIRVHIREKDSIPVVISGDGAKTGDWVFVTRTGDGSLKIDSAAVSEGGPAYLGLDLSPLEEKKLKAKIERLGEEFQLASSADGNFQKASEITEQLSTRLDNFLALVATGAEGFQKDDAYIARLHAEAGALLDFYYANLEGLTQGLKTLDPILNLKPHPFINDDDQRIQDQLAVLRRVKEIVEDNSIRRMCDKAMAMNADMDDVTRRRGQADLLAIVISTTVALGLLFATGGFAALGFLPGTIMIATGGVFGNDIGQEAGRYLFGSDENGSNLRLYLEGKITRDDLYASYAESAATSAVMMIGYIGVGSVAGRQFARLALSQVGWRASVGRAGVEVGQFINANFDKAFKPKTKLGDFFEESVTENLETLFETAVGMTGPAGEHVASVIDCMNGRRTEVHLSRARVTIASQTLADNRLVREYLYAVDKKDALLADLRTYYPGSKITPTSDGAFHVQTDISKGKTVTEVFRPTTEPYTLRKEVTDRIHDRYDSRTDYSKVLAAEVGIVREGDGYRLADGKGPEAVEARLKRIGMPVCSEGTEDGRPYMEAIADGRVIRIYTGQRQTAETASPKPANQKIEVVDLTGDGAGDGEVDAVTRLALMALKRGPLFGAGAGRLEVDPNLLAQAAAMRAMGMDLAPKQGDEQPQLETPSPYPSSTPTTPPPVQAASDSGDVSRPSAKAGDDIRLKEGGMKLDMDEDGRPEVDKFQQYVGTYRMNNHQEVAIVRQQREESPYPTYHILIAQGNQYVEIDQEAVLLLKGARPANILFYRNGWYDRYGGYVGRGRHRGNVFRAIESPHEEYLFVEGLEREVGPVPDGIVVEDRDPDGRTVTVKVFYGGEAYPIYGNPHFMLMGDGNKAIHQDGWRYVMSDNERSVIRLRMKEGGEYEIEPWPEGSHFFPPDRPLFVRDSSGLIGRILVTRRGYIIACSAAPWEDNVVSTRPRWGLENDYVAFRLDGDHLQEVAAKDIPPEVFGVEDYGSLRLARWSELIRNRPPPQISPPKEIWSDSDIMADVRRDTRAHPLRYKQWSVAINGHTVEVNLPDWGDNDVQERFSGQKIDEKEVLEKIVHELRSVPLPLLEKTRSIIVAPPYYEDPNNRRSYARGRHLDGGAIAIVWPLDGSGPFSLRSVTRHELTHAFIMSLPPEYQQRLEAAVAGAIKEDRRAGYRDYAGKDWEEALCVGFENFAAARPAMQRLILNLMLNPEWQPRQSAPTTPPTAPADPATPPPAPATPQPASTVISTSETNPDAKPGAGDSEMSGIAVPFWQSAWDRAKDGALRLVPPALLPALAGWDSNGDLGFMLGAGAVALTAGLGVYAATRAVQNWIRVKSQHEQALDEAQKAEENRHWFERAERDANTLLNRLSFGQELRSRAPQGAHALSILNMFLRGALGREPTYAEVNELAQKSGDMEGSHLDGATSAYYYGQKVGQPALQIYTKETLDAMASYTIKLAEQFRARYGREPIIMGVASGDGRLEAGLNKRLEPMGIKIAATDIGGENKWGIVFPPEVVIRDGADVAHEADIIIGSWWPLTPPTADTGDNYWNYNREQHPYTPPPLSEDTPFDVKIARIVMDNPEKTLVLFNEAGGGCANSDQFWLEIDRTRERRMATLDIEAFEDDILISRLSLARFRSDVIRVTAFRSVSGDPIPDMDVGEIREFEPPHPVSGGSGLPPETGALIRKAREFREGVTTPTVADVRTMHDNCMALAEAVTAGSPVAIKEVRETIRKLQRLSGVIGVDAATAKEARRLAAGLQAHFPDVAPDTSQTIKPRKITKDGLRKLKEKRPEDVKDVSIGSVPGFYVIERDTNGNKVGCRLFEKVVDEYWEVREPKKVSIKKTGRGSVGSKVDRHVVVADGAWYDYKGTAEDGKTEVYEKAYGPEGARPLIMVKIGGGRGHRSLYETPKEGTVITDKEGRRFKVADGRVVEEPAAVAEARLKLAADPFDTRALETLALHNAPVPDAARYVDWVAKQVRNDHDNYVDNHLVDQMIEQNPQNRRALLLKAIVRLSRA